MRNSNFTLSAIGLLGLACMAGPAYTHQADPRADNFPADFAYASKFIEVNGARNVALIEGIGK
ncbi:MAG TPA: hypothetical protein EYG42_08005 [Porticoccaceae bacterium]|jgi:hypothetical protein|nr:hypothetical protein [Porticoccaceae bacterium]